MDKIIDIIYNVLFEKSIKNQLRLGFYYLWNVWTYFWNGYIYFWIYSRNGKIYMRNG